MKKRTYYTQKWYAGYGVSLANTGEDAVSITAYPSREARDKAVRDYRAPNHTPYARMESVLSSHPNVRKAIRANAIYDETEDEYR